MGKSAFGRAVGPFFPCVVLGFGVDGAFRRDSGIWAIASAPPAKEALCTAAVGAASVLSHHTRASAASLGPVSPASARPRARPPLGGVAAPVAGSDRRPGGRSAAPVRSVTVLYPVSARPPIRPPERPPPAPQRRQIGGPAASADRGPRSQLFRRVPFAHAAPRVAYARARARGGLLAFAPVVVWGIHQEE